MVLYHTFLYFLNIIPIFLPNLYFNFTFSISPYIIHYYIHPSHIHPLPISLFHITFPFIFQTNYSVLLIFHFFHQTQQYYLFLLNLTFIHHFNLNSFHFYYSYGYYTIFSLFNLNFIPISHFNSNFFHILPNFNSLYPFISIIHLLFTYCITTSTIVYDSLPAFNLNYSLHHASYPACLDNPLAFSAVARI